jgi:hypothetical protein
MQCQMLSIRFPRTLHMEPVDWMVQLDSQDSGIGIDQVEARRLFVSPFRSENPLVLAQPGKGPDLAII